MIVSGKKIPTKAIEACISRMLESPFKAGDIAAVASKAGRLGGGFVAAKLADRVIRVAKDAGMVQHGPWKGLERGMGWKAKGTSKQFKGLASRLDIAARGRASVVAKKRPGRSSNVKRKGGRR